MTWSITARDEATGAFGIAVSTKLMCVGALCPFPRAGVGAISTQSFVNPYLGIEGLELLAGGLSAEETRDRLAAGDEGRAMRQFAVVDGAGRSAAYSGEACMGWFGHRTADGFAVAGNMLVGEPTIEATVRAYEASAGEEFGERLVRAMEAGQAAGGDNRGRQSAALKIVTTEDYAAVDLRIDDHPDPVAELRRLWNLYRTDLAPVMAMLPTKAVPAGLFDLDAIRHHLPAAARG